MERRSRNRLTNHIRKIEKPPYRVPLMSEIAAIPWNGFKLASTFSGCGGSCLGYRMAGFKVVWANEFVPSAQASYKANCASDSILDCRDIKLVQPSEILAATNLAVGELDILDGSPPCQAFSTAGKRDKGWGENKQYEHGATQKNETLFDEYIRLLRGLQPKVFVAENVKGLVMGTAKGYFLEILAAMKSSGYRVDCRILDAQWLGVPQQRQRAIFVGVRNDLDAMPVHPLPLPYRYSVRDALPWIVDVRQSVFNHKDQRSAKGKPSPTISTAGLGAARNGRHWIEMITGNNKFGSVCGLPNVPNPTVMASGANKQGGHLRDGEKRRSFTIAELRRICAFPDDFVLLGSYAQQWERLGNSVPPLMMKAVAETIRGQVLSKKRATS